MDRIFEVSSKDEETRLDKFLAAKLAASMSRTQIGKAIKQGRVYIDELCVTDKDIILKCDSTVVIDVEEQASNVIEPREMHLDIVYEDKYLTVINKQAGVTVHPGAGNYNNTLVNGLLYHYKNELSTCGGTETPGIVHRLDKDTSGLMVIAKNNNVHRKLAKSLEHRAIKRYYLALLHGKITPLVGSIKINIGRDIRDKTKMRPMQGGGKTATTDYKVQSYYADENFSLVECKLYTGRTHQIRVHMSYKKHPIVGDIVYSKGFHLQFADAEIEKCIKALRRQALHAWKLEFEHPITKEYLSFTSPMPDKLNQLILLMKSVI